MRMQRELVSFPLFTFFSFTSICQSYVIIHMSAGTSSPLRQSEALAENCDPHTAHISAPLSHPLGWQRPFHPRHKHQSLLERLKSKITRTTKIHDTWKGMLAVIPPKVPGSDGVPRRVLQKHSHRLARVSTDKFNIFTIEAVFNLPSNSSEMNINEYHTYPRYQFSHWELLFAVSYGSYRIFHSRKELYNQRNLVTLGLG